jgi:aryl-alcohol dehydrogenase-like predicted oxidoreductase
VHSDGRDAHVLNSTAVVETLIAARAAGHIRCIGFSGKTVDGALAALQWADAIMVEYHLDDRAHEPVMAEAARRDVGVIVKKGLASGRLPPGRAIPFVLANAAVTSMVIGGLDPQHLRENLGLAAAR